MKLICISSSTYWKSFFAFLAENQKKIQTKSEASILTKSAMFYISMDLSRQVQEERQGRQIHCRLQQPLLYPLAHSLQLRHVQAPNKTSQTCFCDFSQKEWLFSVSNGQIYRLHVFKNQFFFIASKWINPPSLSFLSSFTLNSYFNSFSATSNVSSSFQPLPFSIPTYFILSWLRCPFIPPLPSLMDSFFSLFHASSLVLRWKYIVFLVAN